MTSVPKRRTATEIADEVAASFSKCSDARLRELLQSLATHLHAFAREVRLTPREWVLAMEVLAETGRFTDETRQEFILWSDTLGLSMAVDALDDDRDPRATESTVEGPFRASDSPRREYGESIAEQPGGDRSPDMDAAGFGSLPQCLGRAAGSNRRWPSNSK